MKTLKLINMPFGSNVLITYASTKSKIPVKNWSFTSKPALGETGIISIEEDKELIIRIKCAEDADFFKPLEWKGFLPGENNTGVVYMAPDVVENMNKESKIVFKTNLEGPSTIEFKED